jgi:hypothetical protein
VAYQAILPIQFFSFNHGRGARVYGRVSLRFGLLILFRLIGNSGLLAFSTTKSQHYGKEGDPNPNRQAF